ncbi:MAG: hypothetical protein CM1200mP40_00250 [Gammaproteobacteria bacterium]|nr:MAG: hypothetical protein CM1200mP40_00250 [Gammaproteobacteria bacterium]
MQRFLVQDSESTDFMTERNIGIGNFFANLFANDNFMFGIGR